MLANQQTYLRRLAPQFLPALNSQGWEFVSRWLHGTGVVGGGWETASLIFIPGFLGPRMAGHWVPIIIDRQFKEGTTTVIVGDSLGPANFEAVRRMFQNTQFQHAEFRYLHIPRQVDGSNDCAVFMLLVFAAWLATSNGHRSLRMSLESCSAQEFGKNGRRHILKSIGDGRIDLNDDTVASLTFIDTNG